MNFIFELDLAYLETFFFFLNLIRNLVSRFTLESIKNKNRNKKEMETNVENINITVTTKK